MNKNIFVILALVLVAALGLWWYMSDQQAMRDEAMMKEKAIL